MSVDKIMHMQLSRLLPKEVTCACPVELQEEVVQYTFQGYVRLRHFLGRALWLGQAWDTIVSVKVNISIYCLVSIQGFISNWMMRQIERQMILPCNFYWFRIDNKHLTQPWLDLTLLDSAYRRGGPSDAARTGSLSVL